MSGTISRLALCVLLMSRLGMAAAEDDLLTRLQRLAEQGDSEAQIALVEAYLLGHRGAQKSDVEAVKWLRRAAEQGHALAQNDLGFMYTEGRGVTEDSVEAVKWYRKAAEQGYALAQYNLGGMYAKGEGVPENYIEAYAWLNVAAAQGNENAKDGKEIIAKYMIPVDLNAAQRLAREYWEKYVLPFRD